MFGTNPTYQNYGAYQPNYNYTPWYYQPTVTAPQMPQQQIVPDPMPQQQVQQMPQQQPAQTGMQWQAVFVKNESETNGIKPDPGKSIIFIDTEKDTVYIKSTDVSGNEMPMCIYDKRKTESVYITRDEFNKFIEEMKDNGKRSVPAA